MEDLHPKPDDNVDDAFDSDEDDPMIDDNDQEYENEPPDPWEDDRGFSTDGFAIYFTNAQSLRNKLDLLYHETVDIYLLILLCTAIR